jgi:regulator of sigma E protease
MINFLEMIIYFLILIGIIVIFHEGGHLIVSKLTNVKILEFSLGFGPKIFQTIIGKDKMILTIRLFPLGGFVKPLEKNNMTTKQFQQLSLEDQNRVFENLNRWKKMAIVVAGPLFNFILALIVFIIMFAMVGESGFQPKISYIYPNSPFYYSGIQKGDIIEKINDKKVIFENEAYLLLIHHLLNDEDVKISTQNHKIYIINFHQVSLNHEISKNMGFEFEGVEGRISVKNVKKDSVAFRSGILPKDKVVAINGHKIKDLNLLIRLIQNDNNKKPIIFTIQRNQRMQEIQVIPQVKYSNGNKIGYIGVDLLIHHPINQKIKKIYSWKEAINIAFYKVVDYTKITIISLKELIIGKMDINNLSGPISMIKYSEQSAHNGLFAYLNMLAVISISVGIFNLLPIPLLDGGHLLQYIIESIRQRDFSLIEIKISQTIGIFSIMLIFSISIVNDLLKMVHF